MSEGRILFVYMCTLVFAVSFGFVSVIGSMLSCRVGETGASRRPASGSVKLQESAEGQENACRLFV